MTKMMRRAAAVMRTWPGALRWLVAGLIPIAFVFLAMRLAWHRPLPGTRARQCGPRQDHDTGRLRIG
jgi:hypothetical protein